MPVTQWLRFRLSPVTTGTVSNTNSLHVGSSPDSGTALLETVDSRVDLADGIIKNDSDQGFNIAQQLPGVEITGIEYQLGCIIREDGSSLSNSLTLRVQFNALRYASSLSANTGTTSENNLISYKTASQLANNYGGSGTANDPANYILTLGGEGNLFGFNQTTPTALQHLGLRIKYKNDSVANANSHEVAIAGNTFASNSPGPVVRYYYRYPKVTITTGKIKLTSGKTTIKGANA